MSSHVLGLLFKGKSGIPPGASVVALLIRMQWKKDFANTP